MSTTMMKDPNVAVYSGRDGSNAIDSAEEVIRKIVKGAGRAMEIGGHSVVGVVSPVKLDEKDIIQELVNAHDATFEVTHCMPDLIILLANNGSNASSIAIRMLYVGAGNDSRVTVEYNKDVPVSNNSNSNPTKRRASAPKSGNASPPTSPRSVAKDAVKIENGHYQPPRSPTGNQSKAPSKSAAAPVSPNKKSSAAPVSPGTSSTSAPKHDKTRLIVAFDKENLDTHLKIAIVEACEEAMNARGAFTVALSGRDGLPELLASLQQVFDEQDVEPHAENWHVIVADEQADGSSFAALKEHVFCDLPVPSAQIYGLDEASVKGIMAKSGGQLDLAVLGFGSDGRTAGLTPDSDLLLEEEKLVASSSDGCVTLTPPILNGMTRHVIMCSSGAEKGAVLKNVLKSVGPSSTPYTAPRGIRYAVTLEDDEDTEFYPCSMVAPTSDKATFSWIVDADLMNAAKNTSSPY